MRRLCRNTNRALTKNQVSDRDHDHGGGSPLLASSASRKCNILWPLVREIYSRIKWNFLSKAVQFLGLLRKIGIMPIGIA